MNPPALGYHNYQMFSFLSPIWKGTECPYVLTLKYKRQKSWIHKIKDGRVVASAWEDRETKKTVCAYYCALINSESGSHDKCSSYN